MESSNLLDERTKLRIWEVKKKARPGKVHIIYFLELSKREEDWFHQNFFKKFPLSVGHWSPKDKFKRLNSDDADLAKFRELYESRNLPAVIYNDQKDWQANEKWTLRRLKKKYRNQFFKCGEGDDGRSVKMKMKYFIDYMLTNKDDSPLYIFDGTFGEHSKKKSLLDDYKISKYFPDDLFKYGGESSRPPHRWFVVGPARSGTGIHIDPLGTSAWNALVFGHKLWCLFPPNTPRQMIKTSMSCGKNKDEAICWFDTVFPKTQSPIWNPNYKPTIILQRPGETIFVPTGWWHVVLNLDNTVAVTHNFCSVINLPICWFKVVKGRPKFSEKMQKNMNKDNPELLATVLTLDPKVVLANVPESSASESDSSSCTESETSSDEESSSSHLSQNIIRPSSGSDSGVERKNNKVSFSNNIPTLAKSRANLEKINNTKEKKKPH